MGSQTAGGAESHRGCLPIRRRPGGRETASGEGGDGGEGGAAIWGGGGDGGGDLGGGGGGFRPTGVRAGGQARL